MFSRKKCYHCSDLKKRPVIQLENTMEKTWRKPTENPRSKTPSFCKKHCYRYSDLKKHPVIQPKNTMEKTWRKPTENPRSKMPSFSRKHCYRCSDLKKCPVIQPHDRENVEKTHRKPKKQHALIFQKTLLPLLRFEKTPYYPATRWRKHGENPRSNTPSFSRKHYYH